MAGRGPNTARQLSRRATPQLRVPLVARPPTNFIWTKRSPVSGDLLLSLAAFSIPAKSPFCGRRSAPARSPRSMHEWPPRLLCGSPRSPAQERACGPSRDRRRNGATGGSDERQARPAPFSESSFRFDTAPAPGSPGVAVAGDWLPQTRASAGPGGRRAPSLPPGRRVPTAEEHWPEPRAARTRTRWGSADRR